MDSVGHHVEGLAEMTRYPLMDALANRRSRRFSVGAAIPSGGLAYESKQSPQPLSDLEDAVLGFAASGVSGLVLADLAYDAPGSDPAGGNVMATLMGRISASADAVHTAAVFVINDDGTSLLKRPQDFTFTEIDDLGEKARNRDYPGMYDLMKVKVSDERPGLAREVPYVFPFNKWSTNLPGTTYFLPVSELSGMYINLVLSAFEDASRFFVVDDRNRFRPAGIKRFGKSRGGYLEDDPEGGFVFPIQGLEAVVLEFAMAEQAFLGHNLSLVEQAMGLGGWTHFATATETGWFEELGFRMSHQTVAQKMNAGPLIRLVIKLLRRNLSYPYPLGLTVNGADLIRPYCPPYYPTMEKAVLAYVDFKQKNVVQAPISSGFSGSWKAPQNVQKSIPKFSDQCVAATIAYCTYVYETYGRFPSLYGPLRTTLAHQAHHLDLEFYDTFYQPGAYTETQTKHAELWH